MHGFCFCLQKRIKQRASLDKGRGYKEIGRKTVKPPPRDFDAIVNPYAYSRVFVVSFLSTIEPLYIFWVLCGRASA